MRAIVFDRYGSADVLELSDVERPAIAHDRVLVNVHAAAATPLDWHFMRGEPFIMRTEHRGAPRL